MTIFMIFKVTDKQRKNKQKESANNQLFATVGFISLLRRRRHLNVKFLFGDGVQVGGR